jgi:hypothetical protein
MMVAPPPPAAANARPLLAVTDPDSEELQVNGTLVIVVPDESTTVGVILFEVLEEPVTSSWID